MGGFANVLGDVAAGYHEASQRETERQFATEQNKRAQVVDLLGKLASDETAHPETRQNALQMAMETLHQPWNKPIKPDFNRLITTTLGQRASTQPPQQPFQVGDVSMPIQPQKVSLEAPPSPPGMHYTHEELAEQAAQRAGAVTGAQAREQMASSAYQMAPDGTLTQIPVSHAGTQMSPGIPNVMPPGMFSGQPYGDKLPAWQARQNGIPVPATVGDDEWVDVRRNRAGMIVNVTPTVPPVGYLPMERGTVSTDTAGLQTTTGTKTQRKLPGQRPAAPQLEQPPAPPAMRPDLTAPSSPMMEAPTLTMPGKPAQAKPTPATKTTRAAQPVSSGDQPGRDVQRIFDKLGLTPKARENVSAEMDRMLNEGTKPGEKFKGVQQLAYTALQRQGITPPLQGTEATRSMADKGRQILPLIERARQLIAQNPDALGPLSGRWSQLSQKYGNLTGPPKELAGVLTSIYSLAGGLHGWRAIRVADEFQKTYGALSSNAQSLNDGLRAIEDTANSVIKTGYPGRAGDQMVARGGQTSAPAQRKAGDIVTIKGQRIKITAIHPDGTFDGEPAR